MKRHPDGDGKIVKEKEDEEFEEKRQVCAVVGGMTRWVEKGKRKWLETALRFQECTVQLSGGGGGGIPYLQHIQKSSC